MAEVGKITGDWRIIGNLTPDSFSPPSASITNASIATGATGSKIAKEKTEHVLALRSNFGKHITEAVGNYEEVVYVAPQACTLVSFRAMMTATGSAGSTDFDVKINGTSALSAAVNLANTDADNTAEAGTLSTTAVTAGQRISMQVTDNATTAATGPVAILELWHEL